MGASTKLARDDSGFITGGFSSLALALGLIAAASMLASSVELRRAEGDLRYEQDRYQLEGKVATAEVRLLAQGGTPTLQWDEPNGSGKVRLTAEPEFLKLAPSEAARPTNLNVFQTLVDPDQAIRGAAQVSMLLPSQDGIIHRAAIEGAISDERWKACALTFLSPFSRLSAVALRLPVGPSATRLVARTGEIWRITASSADDAWLEVLVRFTGSAERPAAALYERFKRTGGAERAQCLSRLIQMQG